MGYPIANGNTAVPLVFKLILASDHVSPATGKTPTVVISKNGAAFASPAGAVTEIANGWYKVAANATDAGTNGPLVMYVTEASSDAVDDEFLVVAYNPFDSVRVGLTALPNVAAGANGGLPTGNASGQVAVATLATGAIQSIWDAATSALTTAGSIGKRIADFVTGDAYARLGAPAGASVSADIAANTTTLGTVNTKIGTPAGASASADIAAIQTKLGSPAGASMSADIAATATAIAAVPTLSQITGAVLLYAVTGTTTGTPTTTSVAATGSALSSTDALYVGAFLVITSGSLQGVAREITAYTGSSKTFTTQAFPTAPASGVTVMVVGNVPN